MAVKRDGEPRAARGIQGEVGTRHAAHGRKIFDVHEPPQAVRGCPGARWQLARAKSLACVDDAHEGKRRRLGGGCGR